jgi:hypothetical protein
MSVYLSSKNYPCDSGVEDRSLFQALDSILASDYKGSLFSMLGGYQRILADNRMREQWDVLFDKLNTLFKCGSNATLDGPMIGVSLSIRDSDYFRETARIFGNDRSLVSQIEWMATCWNASFASTGLWMGKTFEPVSRETFAAKCDNDPQMLKLFDPAVARIGRNFFREPADPNYLQSLGMPVLTELWRLRARPLEVSAPGFDGQLLEKNIEKEQFIPHSKTGGIFLSLPGNSVVREMKGKPVYQLNYRWPSLQPVYPMTRLIDELVQIGEGIYLGQLVMATRHYGLGTIRITPFAKVSSSWELGEPYRPSDAHQAMDYGYQINGFFLMIDTKFAGAAYADDAFPHLRPRPGETGYRELGYDS